jgi:fluoroquinolone transport system permease protein
MTAKFLSIFRWDVTLQGRQGFYYAALMVTVLWCVVLLQLPPDGRLFLLPLIIFLDLSIFGFYFMAGLLYLEKGEGVLEALVVTPLPRLTYLLSKVASLTLLAMLIVVAVVLVAYGPAINWLVLLSGVVLNSGVLILIGFILAVRYRTISEFLIPSAIYLLPTQLPLLDYLGLWEGWPLYLIPTQATMLLIQAVFVPIAPWQYIYAFGYLIVTAVVVTWLALRAFDRFIAR